MRLSFSSLRTLAGATSVVVPFAIAVHLVAEALALGAGAIDPDFWLRHAYLVVPLALALWSFSKTVGLGVPRSEMIRRCALVRAQLRRAGGGSTILAFAAANLAFFGLTQVLEGVPIASPQSAPVSPPPSSARCSRRWSSTFGPLARCRRTCGRRCAPARARPARPCVPAHRHDSARGRGRVLTLRSEPSPTVRVPRLIPT